MGIQERKGRERERRRQQIMVAAKTVFHRNGFNKATMEDIAREAELSPGTLYLYFKNKNELYASLSLRILQYLLIRLEEVRSKEKVTARKRFGLLKEAIYDVYEFDPPMFIKMFHFQSSEIYESLTTELKNDIRELSTQARDAIAALFQEGIDAHVFINEKSSVLAEMIWAFFSGIVLLEENKKALDGRNNDLKRNLKSAFEIFFRGISKDNQSP
ncbi:MAG: TetR/AcrR family transcriptional regulator [Thermodesulfobacteriota bacterium]